MDFSVGIAHNLTDKVYMKLFYWLKLQVVKQCRTVIT
jgi:hypothetical protein